MKPVVPFIVILLIPVIGSPADSDRLDPLLPDQSVTVNLEEVGSGGLALIDWNGLPIKIVRRSKADLEMLAKLYVYYESVKKLYADPEEFPGSLADICSTEQCTTSANFVDWIPRALREDYFVVIGLNPRTGCSVFYIPRNGAYVDAEGRRKEFGDAWPGGFYDPCSGTRFDLAGRSLFGMPYPIELLIPPYRYSASGQLVIGNEPE